MRLKLEEYIKKVEMDKHDITLVVRGVVKDPIVYMNYPQAATTDYFNECGKYNSIYRDLATRIMEPFNIKWNNPADSEKEQIRQLKTQIDIICRDIIPLIREITQFYDNCLQSSYYFNDSKEGERARQKMSASKNNVDELCKDLEELGNYDIIQDDEKNEYNLLLLLQEVFDDINADVQYSDEFEISEMVVHTDLKKFKNHVLLNIKENIETHAFGTKKFQSKYVWEKKVLISVYNIDGTISIKIMNNGTKFKGKLDHIFEYGYCHGERKHSGLGMNSAKSNIQELGGDLTFSIADDGMYSVIYTIILPQQ